MIPPHPESLTEKKASRHKDHTAPHNFVMAGKLSRPSTSFLLKCRQDVDARHKAGHDGGNTKA
jgi:hypothetical protein